MNQRWVFFVFFAASFLLLNPLRAQDKLDSLLPVRGFSIPAPRPAEVDSFTHFIKEELAPRKVNTLFLLVDYHYQFKSHPELTDSFALSEKDVKKIVKVCKKNGIRIIPQIEMLGHQSRRTHVNKLLEVYPQFDETPWIKMPEKFVWPNPDKLDCKSYCPLYPGIHKILFDVIDELCDVFETNAFHAGMDEVFYLGEDRCPRCQGRDKAELFAGEVRTLHDHLASEGRQLWIWGDRLLDGKTTGLGEWEGSYNNTYRAIDMIPRDVVICDWHYDGAEKTSVYFAMKGFDVVSCPWKDSSLAIQQVRDMVAFREQSSAEMKVHFRGVVETIWSRSATFLDGFYQDTARSAPQTGNKTAWDCFRGMYGEIGRL
jgi:N-acetyl-beta-hexosaminidase